MQTLLKNSGNKKSFGLKIRSKQLPLQLYHEVHQNYLKHNVFNSFSMVKDCLTQIILPSLHHMILENIKTLKQ